MKRILLVALALIMLLSFAGCKKSDGAPKGMKLASSTDLVPYSLYVPEDWVIDEADALTTRAHVSSSDTSSVSIVSYKKEGALSSIDAWWEIYKASLTQQIASFELIEEGAQTIVSKNGAKGYTYKTGTGELVFKHYATATEHGDYVYVILYTAMDGLYETNLTTVKDEIIANFKFN